MHAITCEGIQKDGQRGSKRLTLTRKHLRYLTLMQDRTSKELYIEVNHIPLQVVSSSNPMIMIDSLVTIYIHKIVVGSQFSVEICSCNHHFLVIGKTVGCTLDNGKHLWSCFVKCFFESVKHLLFQLVDLLKNGSTILNRSFLNGVL